MERLLALALLVLLVPSALIGWAVSHLALGLIYYGIFTPVAWLFRAIGRDAMTRTFDRAAPTYWEAYNPNHGIERYLRQF